jgi:hypothetical protein
VKLNLAILKNSGEMTEIMELNFYVIETLGNEMIVGLPTILGPLFDFFIASLEESRNERSHSLASIEELQEGELYDPWSSLTEIAEEETSTPDPLAFGEDILHFMELSVEESRQEHISLLDSHVSDAMKKACPQVIDLLMRPEYMEVFAPSKWDGIKVPPAVIEIKSDLPDHMYRKARPLRPDMYGHAKIEFGRLRTYFYVPSDSSVASPLVISPKATAPFIRFCGDYREINKHILIPQQPIPIVVHELTKATGFKVFVDLDMANSFHQIPITEEISKLLSIATPWGLFRPLFLPEGVSPASGLLQHIVREIFADFEEWDSYL